MNRRDGDQPKDFVDLAFIAGVVFAIVIAVVTISWLQGLEHVSLWLTIVAGVVIVVLAALLVLWLFHRVYTNTRR